MIKPSSSPSKPSAAAALQLQKELKGWLIRVLVSCADTCAPDVTNDRLNDYCKVVLDTDNIFEWTVYLVGPPGTT
jgi:hypothetical protein